MDNENNGVSLRKPDNSWTDPVTGEIYPGGPPAAVSQPQQPTYPTMQQYPQQQMMQQPVMPQQQMQQNYPQMQPTMPQQPAYPAMQQDYGVPMPQQIPNQGMGYQAPADDNMKFCKFCGGRIPMDAVLCTACGRQVEQLQGSQAAPQVIVNNANNNINNNMNGGMIGTPKNKWIAFLLCFFLGYLGVHRFYEGKIGTGILYFFTFGLFGIGVLVDLIILLTKPDPYYV